MNTQIFSYHEKSKKIVRLNAVLEQTYPLKKTFEISKPIFSLGKNSSNDVVLDDPFVSSFHCKIEFRDNGFLLKDLGSTNGTYFQGSRIQEMWLNEHCVFTIGKSEFSFSMDRSDVAQIQARQDREFCGMFSSSPKMHHIFSFIQSIGQLDVPVFIHGETGTGKELVARAIHHNSSRSAGPLITINCGALAKDVVESELFGHERGAFTGAQFQKVGLFEQAHGGTLFLDEIGELSLDLQSKLLRVLESGDLRRVGGTKNIQVNVRIIAATHKDLQLAIQEKLFREDLFFRIYVLPISLPPLRDRKEDITDLARIFCSTFAKGKGIDPTALSKLQGYRWPGNIRELKNVVHRACALSGHEQRILAHHIVFTGSYESQGMISNIDCSESQPITTGQAKTWEEFEKETLIHNLRLNGWNKRQTALKLGIAKSTLHEKVKKYGISEDLTNSE